MRRLRKLTTTLFLIMASLILSGGTLASPDKVEERMMIPPAAIPQLNATYHPLAGGPFSQNWSNANLIPSNDDWSAVPSIIGYRGDRGG